jgi:hypothetical protein
MSSAQFLRHKVTGIKYLRTAAGAMIPVADLPRLSGNDATLRGIQVKCETCETWHPCHAMHPHRTGLECSACRATAAAAASPESQHAAAMRKAAALLRLAQSDNPHEAALAASRAQEIIDRYKLNLAALDDAPSEEPAEEIRNFKDDPLDEGGVWKALLGKAVATVNQCQAYTCAGHVHLIGRPSDVAMVRPFYAYLAGEIERLASRHCKGNSRTYWNNFRLGAVETINQRLKASLAATVATVKAEALAAGNERALVIVQNSLALLEKRKQEVAEWTRANMNLRNRTARHSYSHAGREAGRAAGHGVNLNRSAGALNSTRRALA